MEGRREFMERFFTSGSRDNDPGTTEQKQYSRRDFLKVSGAVVASTLASTDALRGMAQSIETQNKSIIEQNRRLLVEDEFIVPQKVIKAYARIVDPTMILEPVGGYFKKNFLDTEKEQKAFDKEITEMGYSVEDLKKFKRYFSGKNIVFNHSALERKDFKDVLAHERLHKDIDHLPEEEEKILNKARDFIIKDYKDKEKKWTSEIDKLLEGKVLDMKDFPQKQKESIKKHDPILLDEHNETQGLMAIIQNPDEFYTYLMMGKLSSQVENYLKLNFSESHAIYERLKNKICEQIERNCQSN